MKYLDKEQLAAIDCKSFRARTPYPWCNPTGILTEEGFAELTGNMPEVEQFRGFFGKQRKHGQKSHDRYFHRRLGILMGVKGGYRNPDQGHPGQAK